MVLHDQEPGPDPGTKAGRTSHPSRLTRRSAPFLRPCPRARRVPRPRFAVESEVDDERRPERVDVAAAIAGADDGDLIRIVHGVDPEEVDLERGGSLVQRAQAVLELRERAYEVDGELAAVDVRATKGTPIEPEDVEDYRGGG